MSMHCDSDHVYDHLLGGEADGRLQTKWKPNLATMFARDRLVEALGQIDAVLQMAAAHYVPSKAIWSDHEIFNAAAEVAHDISDGSYRPDATLLDEPDAFTSRLKWRIDRVVAALLSEAVKEYVAGQLPPCLLPPTPVGKWSLIKLLESATSTGGMPCVAVIETYGDADSIRIGDVLADLSQHVEDIDLLRLLTHVVPATAGTTDSSNLTQRSPFWQGAVELHRLTAIQRARFGIAAEGSSVLTFACGDSVIAIGATEDAAGEAANNLADALWWACFSADVGGTESHEDIRTQAIQVGGFEIDAIDGPVRISIADCQYVLLRDQLEKCRDGQTPRESVFKTMIDWIQDLAPAMSFPVRGKDIAEKVVAVAKASGVDSLIPDLAVIERLIDDSTAHWSAFRLPMAQISLINRLSDRLYRANQQQTTSTPPAVVVAS